MAEPKRRIDGEMTNPELGKSGQKSRDTDVRPQLLRSETRMQSEPVSVPPSQTEDEAIALFHSAPVTSADAAQVRPGATVTDDQPAALFAEPEVGDYRTRWGNIQTAFVHEPRQAVKDADNLVASLMEKLADGFASERERLERQWDRGDDVSTEDLRVALQRYRAFFDRLLAV